VVIGVVAAGSVLALICTLVSAESPPEKIAPWRAATRTGGVEAVAFSPDGQTVYACGAEKSRRRYHLDGHRFPPKVKGGARAPAPSEEDSPLLVLRWGLTGSQLADVPLWHFHPMPLRLGILIGLALGALGSCYFMACPEHSDLPPGLARSLDFVFRVGLGFSLLLAPLLLIPLVHWEVLSAQVAWFSVFAEAAGVVAGVAVMALASCFWGSSPGRRLVVVVLSAGLLALLLVGSAGGLMLLTTRVPQPMFAVDGGDLPAAAFGPDAGTLALAAGQDANPRIEVREVESGNLIRTEAAGLKDIRRLAVDTTGFCLGATYDTVQRLSGQGPEKDDQTAPPAGPGLGGFLGDGKTLVLLHQDHIRLVDLLLGTEQRLLFPRSLTGQILKASLRSTVLACSGSSSVRDEDRFWRDQVLLWTLPEKTPRVIPLHGEDIDLLALSDDGKRLAVISTTLGKKNDRTPLTHWLRVFDVPSGKEIAPRQKVKEETWWGGGLTFSPRGDILVQGIEEFLVWDLNTGLRSKIAQKDGRVFQIRFSPDGRRLIAIKHPGNIEQKMEHIAKQIVTSTLEEILEPVSGAGSRDKATQNRKPPDTQVVLTWTFPDLKPGKSASTLYEDEVRSVISPDGQLIGGTFLRGRCLLIHQWETGKMLYRPLPIPMVSCVFAPDSKHVAVSLRDGTVIVLRL
jgi:WD40 repeat protein